MFVNHFANYDILCLQEFFGLCTGDLKEVAIAFGQKAGFLYHACQQSPMNHSLYFCDSGLLILSRFPIIEQEFQQFSLGLFSDGEVSRGV